MLDNGTASTGYGRRRNELNRQQQGGAIDALPFSRVDGRRPGSAPKPLSAACLPPGESIPAPAQAMRYSALRGNKRVRPLLVFAERRIDRRGERRRSMPRPAQSNASTSIRWSMTICRAWTTTCCGGAARPPHRIRRTHCLLVGDSLQSLAFELLARAQPRAQWRPGAATRKGPPAGARQGSCGMAGGQAIDLARRWASALTQPELELMHALEDRRPDPRRRVARRALRAAMDDTDDALRWTISRNARACCSRLSTMSRLHGEHGHAGQDRGQGCRRRQADLRQPLGRPGRGARRRTGDATKRAAGLLRRRARQLTELASFIALTDA